MKKESEREAKQNSIEVLEQQMSQLFKMRVDVNDLDPEEIIVKCNKIDEGPITFFVHPIEGIASPLNRVMSKCNFPVYCFQFTRQVRGFTLNFTNPNALGNIYFLGFYSMGME